MFTQKDPNEKTGLEEVIDALLADMKNHEPDTEQYSKRVDQLVKLYKLKAEDKPERVKPDTLALIAGNLAGIVLIIGHERAHVVTSKALSFVLKLR